MSSQGQPISVPSSAIGRLDSVHCLLLGFLLTGHADSSCSELHFIAECTEEYEYAFIESGMLYVKCRSILSDIKEMYRDVNVNSRWYEREFVEHAIYYVFLIHETLTIVSSIVRKKKIYRNRAIDLKCSCEMCRPS